MALTQTCSQCGISKPSKDFSKNANNTSGYDDWCTKCRKSYVISEEKLIEYCKENNRGYSEDLFKQALDNISTKLKKMNIPTGQYDKELIGKSINYYFSKMNLIGNEGKIYSKNKDKKKNNSKIPFELVDKWGKGYSLDELEFLNDRYHQWVTGYECDSPAQLVLFEEICRTQLDIRRARESNQPVDKLVKSLQDLLTSSNVKPVQESGANSLEQASFGVLIKKWENEKPIPEPLDEFKDVDGIKKYMSVWFVGHLSKMLDIDAGVSKDYDNEIKKYTVEVPDEDDLPENNEVDKEED